MSNQIKQNNEPNPENIPSLDGIRGYGFLAVFFAHYLSPVMAQYRAIAWVNALEYVKDLVFLAVPMFFVLSGYLIGGILFRSRNRDGFFRVFYGRRMLRVLPIYYLTLIIIAAVDITHGIHLDYKYWAHFIYIQNLMPGYTGVEAPPNTQVAHLWSLAVEEQFYLFWPIAVWFAKDRKTLLKIIVGLCALSWAVRIASPWIHLSVHRCYVATPTRIDTVLFGVALALVIDHRIYKRLLPFAQYVFLGGIALWVVSTLTHRDLPNNYFRVAVEYSLSNVIAFSAIMAVLDQGSFFARICRARWACWLGNMSYGLYVFHFTYHIWFLYSFRPRLLHYLPEPYASFATALIALAVTSALGMLSFRFVEQPALSLKRHFKYGPKRSTPPIQENTPEAPINLPKREPMREGFAFDASQSRDRRQMQL
jgi:peptidoglycan/LPS O-acetylase OafA/YrhL